MLEKMIHYHMNVQRSNVYYIKQLTKASAEIMRR